MTCSLCQGTALYVEGQQGFCKTHRAEALEAARTRHSKYVRESEQKHQALSRSLAIFHAIRRRNRTRDRRTRFKP